MQPENLTVLITGAARGIGYLLAQEYSKTGARLILIDKDAESLQQLEKEINKDSLFYNYDLSSEIQVMTLIEKLKEEAGGIDILINNAGIGVYENIADCTYEQWRDSFFVNVFTPFLLIKGLLTNLKKSNAPKIINIGSISGLIPMPERIPYNPTKFALRGLSLCLSEEFKNSKLNICHVALGSTLTEFGPLSISDKVKQQEKGKKYLRPDAVAKKIVELSQGNTLPEEVEIVP